VLDRPARLGQQRINGVTGFLFWILVFAHGAFD
jgi:hypothetical protein